MFRSIKILTTRICKISTLKPIYKNVGTSLPSVKICIVGSGPAGFYTAHQLIKGDPKCTVDIFERFPVPFGLVRYGVAPDHPEVKNVENTFSKIALHERVRFVGNITIGDRFASSISITDLQTHYDVVVLAYGASKDRLLNIPGELSTLNVVSARTFVDIYNGKPDTNLSSIDLSRHDTAVIVGVGNVAIDVVRILFSSVDALRKHTDITDTALELLASSRIRHVILVSRRGPLNVAFTVKEFREMLNVPECRLCLDPLDFSDIPTELSGIARSRKRLTELLLKTVSDQNRLAKNSWYLKFFRSPLAFKRTHDSNHVSAIELGCSEGRREWVDCGLVLKSIGYCSESIDSTIPFDEDLGIVRHKDGKIEPGLYVTGWLATGPRGVIADTMMSSFALAKLILADIRGLKPSEKIGFASLELDRFRPTTFDDWRRIDTWERNTGAKCDRPRVKITDIKTMLSVLN